MDELHRNYIAGEWVEGEAGAQHQSVEHRRGRRPLCARHRRRRQGGDRRRQGRVSLRGRAPAFSSATTSSRPRPTRFLPRREEIGRLLSREEGKTLADGIGETVRAGQIFDFFAGECSAADRRDRAERAARHRGVDDARGGRRRRHHHAVEFSDRHSRVEDRAGARHGNTVVFKPADLVPGSLVGDRRHSRARRPAEGRSQPRHGQGLGGRPGDAQLARHQRHHLHRLGRHRPDASPLPRSSICASSSSRWAARIRWSSSTMPTSRSRSSAPPMAPISRPASAARRRRA